MRYSYTVTRVDLDAKCMDVEFSSAEFGPITTGVRLPKADEDIDAVIRASAPLPMLIPDTTEYATVAVGHSGTHALIEPEETADVLADVAMWAEVNFQKQVAKALVKFGVLDTDPTAIGVTQL